jgi:3-deoxy-D-manno-octulosonic-acid transferase
VSWLSLVGYNLLLLPALPWLLLWGIWRLVVGRKARAGWAQRLGFSPRPRPGKGYRIWVHAVSAGEMTAAAPVVTALVRQAPGAQLLVSTTTPAGRQMGRRLCPEAEAVFYFPLDLWPCVRLSLGRLRPELVILTEKELWPNFLALASLRRIPVLLVNGRLSQRTLARARRFPVLWRWAFGHLTWACLQSETDRRRLLAIGADPARLEVAGNTKFDYLLSRARSGEGELSLLLARPEARWIVAGSTHPGEEEALLEAFVRIRPRLSESPALRLLIAPRHVERAEEVVRLAEGRGLRAARRSRGPLEEAEVVVLDTMGELGAAYGLGAVAFVGGSLAPVGGHNVIEPLARGCPVLFGPHVESCQDLAELALSAGAAFQVRTARELAEGLLRMLEDEAVRRQAAARGRALVEANAGAAGRCAVRAVRLLSARRGGRM